MVDEALCIVVSGAPGLEYETKEAKLNKFLTPSSVATSMHETSKLYAMHAKVWCK